MTKSQDCVTKVCNGKSTPIEVHFYTKVSSRGFGTYLLSFGKTSILDHLPTFTSIVKTTLLKGNFSQNLKDKRFLIVPLNNSVKHDLWAALFTDAHVSIEL